MLLTSLFQVGNKMKRLLFVSFFIFTFFCSNTSILAQNATPSSTPAPAASETNTNSFLDWLFSFFFNINKYFAKDYQINPSNVYDKVAYTNYEQKDKDITFRAISDENRIAEKKAYIDEVVAGNYDDRVLGNCSDKPVKISDLAGYTPDPKEYDSTPSCLTTLYDGLQIVPQGEAGGQPNAAPVSSKQLNSNLRTPIPEDKQATPEPGFWENFLSSLGLIDKTAKENERQERNMLSHFIPDKNGSTGDNAQLRQKFSNLMYPASWQKNPPERGDLSNDSGDGSGVSDGSFKGGHKQGLSQYGAQGRALSGQKYDEILKAYYGENTTLKTYDLSNAKIQTTPDNQIMDFEETYLMGIAEMPDSWDMEALKAQVIAARTYAYVYSRSLSKSICTDTHCQVFNPKHITSSPRWKQAVEETKGQMLVDSTTNEPFSTMYSAYHQGQSKSYSSLNHSTASVDDTQYEQKANAPY